MWCRGNKKENAKKTLGNSNSTGMYSIEAAMKEESGANKNEASLSMSGKKTMDSEYMSKDSMEKITSDDKDLKVLCSDNERKRDCDSSERTNTVQQKNVPPYKKVHSEMSDKNANLDMPLDLVDEGWICSKLSPIRSDSIFAFPSGKLNTDFSALSHLWEERGHGSKSCRIRWEYWNSLEMSTFGGDIIPHTLTWKHPLEGKKERMKESIEDLALLFTPSKTERRRRGRVSYRMIESG